MADYSRYKTETLKKMRDKAWAKYEEEVNKPTDGWGSGFRKAHLCDYKGYERAQERYDAICAELQKRKND